MNTHLDRIAHLIDQGQPDLAAQLAAEARLKFPAEVELVRLHGVALLAMGEIDAAISTLEAARALEPGSIETLCNLGSAHLSRGDARAALRVMDSALALAPNHPAALNSLGNARRAGGDMDAARDAYRAATRAAPDNLGAWLNLAAAELALGKPIDAERIAAMILKQIPHPQAWLLLAQSFMAQQRLGDAAHACQQAERIAPNDPGFPYQRGLIADEQKQLGEAALAYARALTLNPDMTGALAQLTFIKRQLCDWQQLDELSSRLRSAVAAGGADITPFGFLAEPATAAEQLMCASNFARQIGRQADPLQQGSRFTQPRLEPGAPLLIGFASNGFGNHPTGLLTVAFIEALAERNIDLHLFATVPADGSPIQQRLQAVARSWHDLHGLSAPAMAARIAASNIEILIDLRVWGGGNISEAFALRPAPIQVNWLAYPGTSGAPWIDYVIADNHVLPTELHDYYSEKIAWLPRCFQPSDPGRVIGEPTPRADCGLPETGTVYVCFNNSYKLDPRSMQRMFAILRAVPDSILWLLAGPAGSDQNLCGIASAAGIDPNRLVFMPKLPHADYLTRYRHADLFLDTAIYNAHTTASDAIWAGCPVLTTPGATFAARVAASLNHHLGMHELNVASDDAFVDFAVRIGHDRAARDALHARLAQRRTHSSLFDMQEFANDFIALLRTMARRHREGLPPAPID